MKEIFDRPVVQRCQIHKVRDVERHLPQAMATTVTGRIHPAYRDPDPLHAEATLEALARSLDKAHPGAAGSVREGLAETLTIMTSPERPSDTRSDVAVHGPRSRALIEICRDHSTNVKRWRDGQIALCAGAPRG